MEDIEEWEIITADEKEVLNEKEDQFIDIYLQEEGYELRGVETHYSCRNLQWESLITFVERRKK